MKILAYRFSAFGDVAMLVPVLSEFLEKHPDKEIVFVSRKNFAELFAGIERLTFKGIDLAESKGVLGIIKLAFQLNQEFRPSQVADFHFVLRSKLLTFVFWLMGKKIQTLHKGRKEKKLLTQKNKIFRKLPSTTERYAQVLRGLGHSFQLSNILPQNNRSKEGIGFAPFAQHVGKMLPLEKSLELLKLLAKKKPVYLFGGGEKEVAVLTQWANQIENVTCMAGTASLTEELEKIAGLEVMVSMDSANMHLASLVGTRCISVWGATHHYAGFLGYGQSVDDIVELKDLSCRPCSVFGNEPCFRGDYACLNNIDIHQIVEKIS